MPIQKPIRLPPLPRLRVKKTTQTVENPCVQTMTALLGCWASAGYNTAGCVAIEQQLRACMDAPAPPAPRGNTINYHLARMSSRVTSPVKGRK